MAANPVRSWRTSFLTLRDETLTSQPPASLRALLQDLVFSQAETLIAAARDLPPHEVASDVMLLVEMAKSDWDGEDATDIYLHTCHLIHDVSCRVCLEINSSYWSIMFEFLWKLVHSFLGKADAKKVSLGNAARLKVTMELLEILRYLVNGYGRICSLAETTQVIKLLLHIVSSSHTELISTPHSNGNQLCHGADTGARSVKCTNIWEVHTNAFVMIGEVLSQTGTSVSVEIWQLTLEVLRKVLDSLVSKRFLVEDSVMSRFYTSVLHCLHLILSNPKASLSEHVAGIVAALRLFFMYGLSNRHPLVCTDAKELTFLNHKSAVCAKIEGGPYRPPHLRKRVDTSRDHSKTWSSRGFSDHDTSAVGFMSSDSEHSDSDGSVKNVDMFRSSKARIAAIICIQDLCQADSKSLSTHCTMILPTDDVLHPRKYEATLMTSLLFDPIIKTRITSASALAAVLEGLSSVFLQVAEYKESTKRGSYTALSSSLGQILMQLHYGMLYLVQRESHSGLLASLLKALMLLISATPYARMPGDLLRSVISTVRTRMIEGFPSRTDQSGLMNLAFGCLGAAFSTSPPSLSVQEMLHEELLSGIAGAGGKQSVFSVLFQFSERLANPTNSIEALQVLRALSHNYPNIMVAYWDQVSSIVYGLVKVVTFDDPSSEGPAKLLKGDVGYSIGPLQERCIMAGVKVLDECLRAISGFKGTEDLLDDRSMDTPFTSDCTRLKRISSAPSHVLDGPEVSKSSSQDDSPGKMQWCEAIEKHLPLTLSHGSAMVRAAAVTCFAGITSSVFFSLMMEKQDFILSSSTRMALRDEVPSVRSAACRAIGVIACFPQISQRAEIMDKFIHATEHNTHDALVTVRITASWALANICDSLRHRVSGAYSDFASSDLKTDSHWIPFLAECALRLTSDGDKIKSNAVRALGNLSRFVRFTSLSTFHKEPVGFIDPSLTSHCKDQFPSETDGSCCYSSQTSRDVSTLNSLGELNWLERMVQAFVSCVTTGNVKVRWNVCHALSNLFLNETLRLQDMAWAPSVFSILLLLLRDSSNYKIRIHAAAALAVPASRSDYGSSFSNVIQGIEHVLETLGSDQISTASSFKYRDALEKQLTSTTLHVLGLSSGTDNRPLKEFLLKKALFLEDWFKSLCSSLIETSNYHLEEAASSDNQKYGSLSFMQKKEMISKAIRSLVEVYESINQQAIARRFEKLINGVS